MRIAVVGLGIAGLTAALRLEQAGHEVHGYEARSRVGGRLWTVQEEGVSFEAGGEWIDADHAHLLALLAEFDMTPVEAPPGERMLFFQGESVSEENLWIEALEDDLRLEAAARSLCQKLRRPAWLNTGDESLDQKSLADFLDEHVLSEKGKWWIRNRLKSDEGEDPERVGLLGWLAGYLNYLDRETGAEMSAFKFPGGASSLCNKMAFALRGPQKFGAILQRVNRRAGQVELVFQSETVQFDAVVLTLPPRNLEHLVFDPGLPLGKRCAVEACTSGRAIKIAFQFETAWWKALDWNGEMHCDLDIMQTWDGTMPGGAPVLLAYSCGVGAEKLLQAVDPLAESLSQLESLFPGVSREFTRGWVIDWIHDPFSRGGFSYLPQNFVLFHLKDVATPLGNVYFAGEHTSAWSGFVEGAVESGERVAREVISK